MLLHQSGHKITGSQVTELVAYDSDILSQQPNDCLMIIEQCLQDLILIAELAIPLTQPRIAQEIAAVDLQTERVKPPRPAPESARMLRPHCPWPWL